MISSSQLYKFVDYERVYSKANEILATSAAIDTFPYKIKDLLLEQADIRMCSYEKANRKFGVDIVAFGSESAVLIEKHGMNIMFYNQNEPDYRIRFSLLHELGHYLLQHNKNLNADCDKYRIQELEANCFAAQMLMPDQIVNETIRRGNSYSVNFLVNSFAVSMDAAIKRNVTISRMRTEWKTRAESEFDDLILYKYQGFIDKVSPIKPDFYDFETENERQKERDSWR